MCCKCSSSLECVPGVRRYASSMNPGSGAGVFAASSGIEENVPAAIQSDRELVLAALLGRNGCLPSDFCRIHRLDHHSKLPVQTDVMRSLSGCADLHFPALTAQISEAASRWICPEVRWRALRRSRMCGGRFPALPQSLSCRAGNLLSAGCQHLQLP